MSDLNALLDKVVATNKARRAAEEAERAAKAELLTFLKLSGKADEGVHFFPLPDATVTVKRRTTVKVLAKDTLLALLGKRREEVLEPSPAKVWGVLSKEPSLMAQVLASGAIGLSLTEFVDVTMRKEEREGDIAVAKEPEDATRALGEVL